MPRLAAALERAAATHEKSAAVHDDAADFFARNGRPAAAARERDLARQNREAAGADWERARLRRELIAAGERQC